jgi:ectoine hydroxylase-related dioxygenase (phytanoyl-CoA dioxygenase family)
MSATESALASFGARRSLLSAEQRDQLDRMGYLLLPDAIDAATVEALRSRFDALIASERQRPDLELRQKEAGANWVINLVDKDVIFDAVWNHPAQLAAVGHVLGWNEIKLFSLKGRAALPGEGQQALHVDWPDAVEPGAYQVCNSAWMLDDFTAENGATRVVPGSHRWHRTPADTVDVADQHDAHHPQEVLLTGTAGTCAIFNSHVWHGGTLNCSTRPRRVLLAAFVRREHEQQTIQRDNIHPETMKRLSSPQRYLLDV